MRGTGQARTIGFALLAAVAQAAIACGGKDVEVPVTLTLDEASCTVDTPDWVELSCPTAVGVALWGAESEDRLGGACVDLPGTDRTLQALPPLLAGVDLSASGDESVVLEIGLFAPRAASDGCPEVSAGDADMLLYGETEPTDLSASVRGLAVNIVCVEIDTNSYELCYTACDDRYNSCFETTWCQQTHDACADRCTDGDADCLAACQTDLDACTVDECAALNQDCMSGCPEEGCGSRCTDENTECLEYGACDARYTTCLNDCDAAPPEGCAAVY